jgi:SAM-dependent methyltransferase
LSPASPEPGAPPVYAATDGAAYDWFLGRWTARLAVPFVDFAALPAGGPVLEIGCGTGSLARQLRARWPERPVVGVDLSMAYIAHARAQPGGAIQYAVADAQRLCLPDATFAGALAQLVLNFVPDAEAAAREARRVVRPGGTVAATVWDFRGGLVYQRLFWDTASGLEPSAGKARDRLFSTPLATPEGLADLWRRCGLAEVATGSLTIRMDYASFDDYWRPLLGGQGPVGTYVNGLAPDRQALVQERVRAAYLAGGPDGPRSMTATAWAVRGIAL